jgi:hypothetical protein
MAVDIAVDGDDGYRKAAHTRHDGADYRVDPDADEEPAASGHTDP